MTQIFVGNLAYTTSEQELRSAFEHYGKVLYVRVPQDRQTSNPRGFAFVSMPKWDDADEAITRLNGTSIGGRRIVVNQAKSESGPDPIRTTAIGLLGLL